ncbi:protein of unknown function DUF881 [Alkaliphilus metalliredigens QYMF]|uniref:Division initiation protein n=1 Tax=Alkaliphilus metalliredigens (strain QYMF) TaxID=293826 RepID=A6TKZ4_ALKMQ|nr:DUF881 domain-containing protein [Alkaliphilus metalliredigens]ABR46862.1 protein of unknown function DUF881 [Alkaliphilus metalliredigens QYMF]
MNNLSGRLMIVMLCVFLGISISIHYKSNKTTSNKAFIPQFNRQQISIELNELKNERTMLMEELTNLEKRVAEYKISRDDENVIINNLKTDLQRYHMMIGSTDVKGPGLKITLTDSPSSPAYDFNSASSVLMYNYEMIVYLISILNATMAEAISINDQRYIDNTAIYFTSNNIMVNSVPMKPPFVITAIGTPEDLESALYIRQGFMWEMETFYNNVQVEVEKVDEVIIPRYDDDIDYKYAKPAENI